MAVHSLFPSFVKILYQSNFGAHVMTRPTRQYEGTPWVAGGTFTAWDESPIDADAMIQGLIDLMLPLFTANVVFTSYLIYNQATAEDLPVPVFAKNLTGKLGTLVTAGQYAAYAKTYTYITSDSNVAKLVLLDVPTGGVVNKSTILPGGAEGLLIGAMLDPQYAWAGRDDGRPVAWRSVSNDVNDALRKKYRI